MLRCHKKYHFIDKLTTVIKQYLNTKCYVQFSIYVLYTYVKEKDTNINVENTVIRRHIVKIGK